MRSAYRISLLGLFSAFTTGIAILTATGMAAQQDETRSRIQAKQLRQQGNWKDALEVFRRLAQNPTTDPTKVHEDVDDTIQCLSQLGMMEEANDFLKSVVEKHSDKWRVLAQSANAILQAPHHGLVSSNVFHRAPQRNDSGAWVFVQDQDRQQALAWLNLAIPLVEKETDKNATTGFYSQLARTLLDQRSGQSSWLLQSKTDLTKVPNYIEIEAIDPSQANRFAPVDADGKPVLYSPVESWNQAVNDGQRLRWAIDRWSQTQRTSARLFWAEFLTSQFGVETLANDSLFYRVQASFSNDSKEKTAADKTGTYALHTLDDSEAIARLANGIQRFVLTDEWNPIHIYQGLIQDAPKETIAYSRLVDIYTNRRQYAKAANICRQAIEAGIRDEVFKQSLSSIIEPRGRFDMIDAQPAGKPATVGFVFRNAEQASFTAAKFDEG